MTHVRLVRALAAALALASSAAAQAPGKTSTVHIRVVDSAGAPVVGADLSVMRGLADVLAHGLTDARGEQSLTIRQAGSDAELVVRKIGYQRASRFFADSVTPVAFAITIARSVRALDTMKVTAAEDVRRKSYFIDADAIQNSPRTVVDALDIVMKLRPDMIWGRAGEPDRIDQHASGLGRVSPRSINRTVAKAQKFGYCAPVENVWVNGSRIRNIATDPVAALKRVGTGLFINAGVATVLGSIKPEHIAEIQYHPCTDAEGDSPARSNNAIMVQLKEGIGFIPGAGSFVAAQAPARRAPAVVGRILGVFDEDSGDPMNDVEVVDVATGTIARTTATGTVSLVFLPAGESQLRIQRAGYATHIMPVLISPSDTLPITVVLGRAKVPPERSR